ncbi:hypothetical protein E4413_02240 [Leptospira interrogans]|uniref:Uncharacterized protein n=1 Tax=Leptospira interrogans serovar Bataviae TaxID=312175 RepID=A0AAQ0B1K1_LEPIR|nr:hypothetical protein C5473_10005 [Leptospira interrogans serovar Weerasinghe]KAA1290338.1 hypothetical protein C4X99_08015 [Leptospira interrogans serovar Geyaweera]MBE0303784.1 hypothetical protein [Leptospira interrogans serovar Yeoncheon]QCO34500.1 hypothetical protein E4414_16640 [Leptospira interrogans]QOI33167.1 hypothetical protein LeptoLang_02220 [Leptospira interrogans serovar Icterohaemorrhagiae]QOI37284.1 hypothetical protein Lepto1548_02545 [Leptospira interrogans serovar Batavi
MTIAKRRFHEEIGIEKVVFEFYKGSLMEELIILTNKILIKDACVICRFEFFFINCFGVNVDFSC